MSGRHHRLHPLLCSSNGAYRSEIDSQRVSGEAVEIKRAGIKRLAGRTCWYNLSPQFITISQKTFAWRVKGATL
jgi:hypothetical protein